MRSLQPGQLAGQEQEEQEGLELELEQEHLLLSLDTSSLQSQELC